jgi:hypothetical protein
VSIFRERPILFSAPMVRAILEGRKTVTRRVVKNDWIQAERLPIETASGLFRFWCSGEHPCPYGRPGERLWVRETWAQPANLDPGPTVYRATYPDCLKGQGWENLPPSSAIRWKPSIHMFRRDSRILLEITGVRVERLQDITGDQAEAEGVDVAMCQLYLESSPSRFECKEAVIHGFAGLWESINGAGAWDANPWVWVVEFKRVTT